LLSLEITSRGKTGSNTCVLPRSLFQTGWLAESLLTQTLIIHIIRNTKILSIQSRASYENVVHSAMGHAGYERAGTVVQ
jgi:hypothetical protein